MCTSYCAAVFLPFNKLSYVLAGLFTWEIPLKQLMWVSDDGSVKMSIEQIFLIYTIFKKKNKNNEA